MFKKKILPICIITIILSGAIVPIVDSIKLKNDKFKQNFSDEYLVVYAEKLEFDRVEYIIDEKETDWYSIYNANYKIKNIGKEKYEGIPVTEIRPNNSLYVFDYWTENEYIVLDPNESVNLSHEVSIKSKSDLPLINSADERYFADHILTMITDYSSDTYPSNYPNYCNIRAKYWNNKSNYQPTLSHLIASTPWRYKKEIIKINDQELYYLELPKLDRLPEIIKNERMGWIKELSFNLDEITKDIKTILNENNNDFVLESWGKLKHVNTWIMNISKWFAKLANGTHDNSQIDKILDDFENITKNNIKPIEDISKNYYQKIISPVKKLVNHSTKLCEIINKTPWKKQITIQGQINGIKNNKNIKITCRDTTKTYTAGDNEKINYEFTVPSKNSEENYYEPHNCTITVEDTKSEIKIQFPSLLCYSFSNGTINKDFTWPPGPQITKPKKDTLYIQDKKIIPWFSTKCIGPIKIKVETTNQNNDNIELVKFYIDGKLNHTDNKSPYECNLTPKPEEKTYTHTIKTVTYDNYGYITTEEIKIINIPLKKAIGRTLIISTILLIFLSLLNEV